MSRSFSAGLVALALEMGCGGISERRALPGAQGGSADMGGGGTNVGGVPAAGGETSPTVPASCPCVNAQIAWWRDDGGAPVWQAVIRDCDVFTFYGREPAVRCTAKLEPCEAWLGVGAINEALFHPDVQDALEGAPVLFGVDQGQVDHIEVDGKVIEVGNTCTDDPACQLPRGVEAFDVLLGHLQTYEQERQSCEPQ